MMWSSMSTNLNIENIMNTTRAYLICSKIFIKPKTFLQNEEFTISKHILNNLSNTMVSIIRPLIAGNSHHIVWYFWGMIVCIISGLNLIYSRLEISTYSTNDIWIWTFFYYCMYYGIQTSYVYCWGNAILKEAEYML